MDLTFQVPIQYCSLQLRTLLLSAVPSTTGCCFGSIPSFFLELFLHWSPVAYWHLPTWGVHLSVSNLFAFSYCSWGSQGKNTEVVCHSLLQWTTFFQNSPPWPVCLGWPYMAWLRVSLSFRQGCEHYERQIYMTLKDELPRSVGAQYATGDQRRNNSRKNEETEPE